MKKKFLALLPITFLLFSCDFSFAKLKEWWDNDGLPSEKEDEKPKEDDKGDDEGGKEEGGGDVEPEITYDIVIDSKSDYSFESADDGYLHQMEVGDQVLDAIGYESSELSLGSIKKVTYGAYTFNGMVYNRSLINGLDKLCVTYSGGTLQYIFSEYLMQDMNFNEKTNNNVESGKALDVPKGTGYFVFYNKSETPITIESVKIKMSEEKVFDAKMIYTKDTQRGGARSNGIELSVEDSFIQLQNKPTQTTNNYSHGHDFSSDHDNAWYRWNGRYFTDSADLGTDFTFAMTIATQYDKFVNQNSYFHTNVWPQFSYGNSADEQWIQTYIGNDNYEPLGAEHALNPTDPYVDESYAGRFYADYNCYNSNWEVDYDHGSWKFADPDIVKIPDGTKTLREAYQENELPFWFLKFHVYLNGENDAMCDISINGTVIYSTYVFENYDTVNKPSIHIHTLPMHLVNYGKDVNATPDDPYTGCFTYPRLMSK